MRYLARLFAILAAAMLAAQPVAAQSILRDAETEAFLDEISAPLVEAAGLEPENVDIVLINDPSINAFVAGGQIVYIHSGLIDAADTAEEVQGVIAHELGHITGGHILRYGEGMASASRISLLSLIAGIGAALAGAGEAAMGIMAAGQQAAMGKFLAFSRTQESSADFAGAEYLSKAGISGRGSLAFFGKLLNQEYRYGYSQSDEAGFYRTHPLSGDRISALREVYEKDPAWDRPANARNQANFERVKAKLVGYIAKPSATLRDYPESDRTVPALYARAYAYHQNARVDRALDAADQLLAKDPDDPYFLELKGQVLLESGRPLEALEPLRRATALTNAEPLIASLFGHALIATEDDANFAEAERVLRAAVGRDRRNPFAWYQLGVVYAARGDTPRARLASAEQQVMSGQYGLALRSAQAAEHGLERGTPDWIRAQDIGMQARALLERQCEMERGRNCAPG
ncbi:MAG: M48 family metalloprotease [Pseudomonadota bacterium]|jgi:predicted Zn-dependent protease|uniref:M48 family metalloprotease n=1 Tax=Qipengyuania flava TaxID=192812 RepID=UPI00141B11F7|nr:M48 family metalloprotease [Qipengyuania flava]MEC7742381.1 M48 family metalloprotease [Pseudomonadota bacterium]MBW3166963.1 M48 family metalloprotease [Qipengyuania flava]MBY5964201.1 M48 family metalloprotease [Qipengyuania flava]MBY6010525.1 M48 family metalloprotease [Qipengyuania flava]MBY6024967.1 M48 family metalloprotease [Qipengyuania flava]